MTLRYIDGFDYLPTGAPNNATLYRLLQSAGYYTRLDLGDTPGTTTGRFGVGKCLLLDGSVSVGTGGYRLIKPIDNEHGTTVEEGVLGMAFYFDTITEAEYNYIGIYDAVSDVPHFTVKLDQNGVIKVYRGYPSSGTLLGSSWAGAYYDNNWFYIEIKTKIANTGGYVQVRVNTVIVLDLVDFDTQNSTHAYFDSFIIGTESQGGVEKPYLYKVDDIYVLDTTGSINNNFLGNVRVRTQFTSGVGDSTDFTPVGAATNWQAASNIQMDDTKYVYSPNIGDKDLYQMEAIINGPIVHGVQLRGGYRQDDATQRNAHNVLLSGATEEEGDDHFINFSYTYYTDIWELNPDTGLSWTGTEVNAIQSGPKVAG